MEKKHSKNYVYPKFYVLLQIKIVTYYNYIVRFILTYSLNSNIYFGGIRFFGQKFIK